MMMLQDQLRKMKEEAKHGDLSVALYLFGVRYAPELKDYTIAELGVLARNAGYTTSQGQEIRKAIKLAPYVKER